MNKVFIELSKSTSHKSIISTKKSKKTFLVGFNSFGTFFFNWDSLHARLNSHYEAWRYKKKKYEKIRAHRKSVYSRLKATKIIGQRKAFL